MTFPERKLTLSEQAYYEIKRMIAQREILPGAALVLQTLATKLGMSRMPVVEAIRRLERDGLVTLVPQWGATVKVWSLDEIREAHSIRRALEGEAARLFVKRATPEDKRRLAELSDKFDRGPPRTPSSVMRPIWNFIYTSSAAPGISGSTNWLRTPRLRQPSSRESPWLSMRIWTRGSRGTRKVLGFTDWW